MKRINIFTDGGSRGNPGPAAIGIYVVEEKGEVLLKRGKQIGITTNNVAEYSAVREALFWIKNEFKNNDCEFYFFLDSSLVVNQLNGFFKIKNIQLKKIIMEIKEIERGLSKKIVYNYIPREKNKIADFLVNASF
jgi:ribonuclease HI